MPAYIYTYTMWVPAMYRRQRYLGIGVTDSSKNPPCAPNSYKVSLASIAHICFNFRFYTLKVIIIFSISLLNSDCFDTICIRKIITC